jgi:hypothetical protein
MNGSSRRQWVLLSVLVVAVFGYFRFGGGGVQSGAEVGELPLIDAGGLVKALLGINTVKPDLIGPPPSDSDPDRNIFQYGEKRAPAPPPMTEEQRKAEEQRLKDLENLARVQNQKQSEEAARQQQVAAEQAAVQAAAQAEAQARAQEELVRNPPPPPPPVRPTPPAMNYKFVGVMGPATRKVGVFMDGDKMVLARKGEIIDGKFRVIEIGVEWAWMGYADPKFKDDRKKLDLGS